ncbi:MAG TPA: hypothetical protein VLL98_01330 [Rickettsiales bacterium]|nr:hypothetical protein [Rickettsiales bacterium]
MLATTIICESMLYDRNTETNVFVTSKYNTDKCFKFVLSSKTSLLKLKEKYQKFYSLQPSFIYEILQDSSSIHTYWLRQNPHLYEFLNSKTKNDSFILIPNIKKINCENFINNTKDYKNFKGGLNLVGYYIHEDQIKESVFNKKESRISLTKSNSDFLPIIKRNDEQKTKNLDQKIILDKNNNYLVTILDLNHSHIMFLREIKSFVKRKLLEDYNVDFEKDKVEMFFHFPTDPITSTLHLHIRVNVTEMHPIEESKRYYLDDIINYLDNRGNMEDLIFKKKNVYLSSNFRSDFLEKIDEIRIETIDNPYKIFSAKIIESSLIELKSCDNILKYFFSENEIKYLYNFGEDYTYKYILRSMLDRYFSEEKVRNIINNNTFFRDLNNGRMPRGRFERQFADKFICILNQRQFFKQTNFNYNIESEILNYSIKFVTNEEYYNGFISCVGQITDDCESLGRHGTNYIYYDYFSPDSRRIFIKNKKEDIIGQSLIFLNDTKDKIIISSICVHNINSEEMKLLIENFSIKLLEINPLVKSINIGMGGRNFIVMNAKNFPSKWPQNEQEKTNVWKAWQNSRRNSNPDENDIKLCSESLQYPIDINSNKTLKVANEKVFNMQAEKRPDTFRIAELVNRQNLDNFKIKINCEINNFINNKNKR